MKDSTPIEFVVSANDARLRLDQFLAKRLPEYSRSRLQQLIRTGFVRLNEQTTRPRQIVRSGDKINLIEPPLEKIETLPEPIPLNVLFEDDDLIVINKPAGLTVHPGAGQREHTLVNALLSHCRTLSGIGGKERPGIVHRLDKETSGCLVVAKNDIAHRELSRQFAATAQSGWDNRRENRPTSGPSPTNAGDFPPWPDSHDRVSRHSLKRSGNAG